MEEAGALAAEWSRTAAAALAELTAAAATHTPAAHALTQQRAVEYALPQIEIGWTDVALVSSPAGDDTGLCRHRSRSHSRRLCSAPPPPARPAQSLTPVPLVSMRLCVLRLCVCASARCST